MNQTVIDVYLHLRGELPERRRLPAVPVVGSYIYGDERRLYQVSAVVFDGQSVHVYATEVSASLAGELQAAWTATISITKKTLDAIDGELIVAGNNSSFCLPSCYRYPNKI